jgi:hypothetical protein
MDLIDVESFTAEPDSDVFYSGDSEVARVRHYPGRDINRRPRFLGCQSKTFVDLSGGSRYPEFSFFWHRNAESERQRGAKSLNGVKRS